MNLKRLFSRRALSSGLREEMQQHVDERAEELMATGIPRLEAFERARREFGNATLLEERATDVWRWVHVENALRDVRLAIRRLYHSPALTATCILTLALGLGANIALFSVVRSVLLKPLPFRDPDTLVMLYESNHQGAFHRNQVAGGTFLDWKRRSTSFEDMALWGYGSRDLSNNGQLPEKVQLRRATWNLFPMLGVPPAYGRLFTASDDRLQAAATTLLTWGLFERRFGGDPAIVGQTLLLDGKPHTIIGVLPKWFSYPDSQTQLWLPAFEDAPARSMQSHGMHFMFAVARLKPGVSGAHAQSELDAIQKRVHDENLSEPTLKGAELEPLIDSIVRNFKTPLYVLLGAVACMLLITCLNVANLLIARIAIRHKELSVRAALGASKLRLLGEQMIESFLLAASGCVAAMALAAGAVRWMVAERKDIPRAEFIQIDASVLLFGLGIALLSALIAGLLPAASALREGSLTGLRESRSVSGNRAQSALRKTLLGVEVAFTVVLLICAGLLVKSFYQLRSVKLGFAPDNLLTMRFSLPQTRYAKPAQKTAFFQTVMERVRQLPGVESAGLGSTLPTGGYTADNLFTIPEHPPLPRSKFQFAIFRGADSEFFSTLKIPILRGRAFREAERLENAHVAIVSQAFASEFFPQEDPLGKHLRLDAGAGLADFQIVGVVGDTPFLISEPMRPMMYVPLLGGTGFNEAALAVRTRVNPASLALPIQKQIAQLDPELALADILTMDQRTEESTTAAAFDSTLISGFAALSLLLAAVGLYGVLSYVVTQRTSELGIRLALGAKRTELLRLLLLDGMRPAVIGLLFGLGAATAAARLLKAMLFGVKPLDASVFGMVAVLLLGVAAAACLLPAWRASTMDPIRALRIE